MRLLALPAELYPQVAKTKNVYFIKLCALERLAVPDKLCRSGASFAPSGVASRAVLDYNSRSFGICQEVFSSFLFFFLNVISDAMPG